MKRILAASALLVSFASWSQAESTRALLTKENKFPEKEQLEVGSLFQHREFEDRDVAGFIPYGRYGLTENVTILTEVPLLSVEPENENLDNETGLGDIRLGLDLLAYEDIFEYPYVIPHWDVQLETGDEETGLGNGETIWTFGFSVGTVVYDCLHYVGDVSYSINGGTETESRENVLIFAGSIIWDISKKFSVLVEGKILEENSANDRPYFFQGGMAYKATENLQISWYGGGWSQSDEDVVATLKLGYSF